MAAAGCWISANNDVLNPYTSEADIAGSALAQLIQIFFNSFNYSAVDRKKDFLRPLPQIIAK